MTRIMGPASNIPTTENLCAMVTQHVGAGAGVRSKVGHFLKRTSVSADKAIQNTENTLWLLASLLGCVLDLCMAWYFGLTSFLLCPVLFPLNY